jgi:hypothetical protein
MNELQTVEKFAPRIDMAAHAIYRAIREGQFPFPVVKIGRQIRIDARALNSQPQNSNSETELSDANQTSSALAA